MKTEVFKSSLKICRTQVIRSGFRIQPDPDGNGVFPASFRPDPAGKFLETAGKKPEGGSSIPARKIIVKDTGKSRLFRKTENQVNSLDPAGNRTELPGTEKEIPGNDTENHRILRNASTRQKIIPPTPLIRTASEKSLQTDFFMSYEEHPKNPAKILFRKNLQK